MPQERNSRAGGLCSLLFVGGAILALNVLDTSLRFEYPPLNYLTVILLSLALPVVLFWVASSVSRRHLRWPTFTVALLVSLPAGIISLFALFGLSSVKSEGVDASFERIGELKEENGLYRLYRTNGGATTSFGLVLRKERPLPLGLKLVTQLTSFYPASDATFERTPYGNVRLVVAPYQEGGASRQFEFEP